MTTLILIVAATVIGFLIGQVAMNPKKALKNYFEINLKKKN